MFSELLKAIMREAGKHDKDLAEDIFFLLRLKKKNGNPLVE